MDGFTIEKWDRFFALYENGELLCVTVYKKGALAVLNRLQELKHLNGDENDTTRVTRDAEQAKEER
jgi:hypothetical protein